MNSSDLLTKEREFKLMNDNSKNTAKTRKNPSTQKDSRRSKNMAPKPIDKKWNSPIIIENLEPQIDGGLFAVKTIVGRPLAVSADIYKDGHDVLGAQVEFRSAKSAIWNASPLLKVDGNDRWEGVLVPASNAVYEYRVSAWVNAIASWTQFISKKCLAFPEVQSDLSEGLTQLSLIAKKAPVSARNRIRSLSKKLEMSKGASDEVLRLIESTEFKKLTAKYILKEYETHTPETLELVVDRKQAEFSTWYEMFPRSQGKIKSKSGTFNDCIKRLPDIKKMGFDVIYLPPIHPIGITKRKGPNNALVAGKGDPGSPWAIGNKDGGHKSIHAELGTPESFRKFVKASNKEGIEIALDIAFQCSPDHPYVRKHPDWFFRLPDGTIRFAENPPKKYEDIYPINFHCADWQNLWNELKSVFTHWINQGVKIFRVDNPHTKPLFFWRWVIGEIRREHPEVIFLAEAFTRPKVMKFLAKAGFTQSYTYFTWRNRKADLREYLEELTQTEMRHYYRANFFANTPDILHEYLQSGGLPAFKIRALLAATLSPTYGIYSGYELCENTPARPNSEEYLDSEKYQIRKRNWSAPGNIKAYISRLNRLRKTQKALQEYSNLRFYHTHNEDVLAYGKKTADNANIIVAIVNLNPFETREDLVGLPIWEFGLQHWQTYKMKDLITGEKYFWRGEFNYVRLDPRKEPAHLFELIR